MTRGDVEALADAIAALLAKVESGELAATTPMRHRLEGALVALRAVLGDASDALRDLLGE